MCGPCHAREEHGDPCGDGDALARARPPCRGRRGRPAAGTDPSGVEQHVRRRPIQLETQRIGEDQEQRRAPALQQAGQPRAEDPQVADDLVPERPDRALHGGVGVLLEDPGRVYWGWTSVQLRARNDQVPRWPRYSRRGRALTSGPITRATRAIETKSAGNSRRARPQERAHVGATLPTRGDEEPRDEEEEPHGDHPGSSRSPPRGAASGASRDRPGMREQDGPRRHQPQEVQVVVLAVDAEASRFTEGARVRGCEGASRASDQRLLRRWTIPCPRARPTSR